MPMELLEQLERRITALLQLHGDMQQQLAAMEERNAELEKKLADAKKDAAEIDTLRGQLSQEQHKNRIALDRVEGILKRLKERTDKE